MKQAKGRVVVHNFPDPTRLVPPPPASAPAPAPRPLAHIWH